MTLRTTVTLLLPLLSFGILEIGAFAGGVYLKKKGVFYNAPDVANFDQYLTDREPSLGWPSQSHLRERHDALGARPDPNFPPTQEPCVSLYGDSFTWSDQVTNDRAWGTLLGQKLGCRAANFGVSGYGTDQMVLRYEQNHRDRSPTVILNHFTGDIRRNVNRLRNLMAESDSQYILLKPRFVLRDGAPSLVPIFLPTRESIREFSLFPERFLDDEYYIPGGHAGIHRLTFPYTLSLARAFGNEHIRAKAAGEPVWKRFYDPSHPSQALELTAGIMARFVNAAKNRGQEPLLTIIPNVHDLKYFRKNGRWSYEPLIAALAERGFNFIDFGPILHRVIGLSDPCDFTAESCYGHFNARGYEIIAQGVFDHLQRRANEHACSTERSSLCRLPAPG
jgi:hypothetical protein